MISSDDSKMTWNHTKIIAVDGTEALVGGHNLNMDLFRNYPPVHDVSVVVHGEAAYGSQLFLNKMWECGTDLLTKEYLDAARLSWNNGDNDRSKPADPLVGSDAITYMSNSQRSIVQEHQSGVQKGVDVVPARANTTAPVGIRAEDLQTLTDLEQEVFQERITYNTYDKFPDYKLATRMLSVGKYWKGPNQENDYQKASELMKEQLIRNAKHSIRMSQMDLVSAWKKNWSDHVVCQWVIEALLANKNLKVEVVVSPLDAGAGAAGDQYSFGSGGSRTFDLIKYYMTHAVDTDIQFTDRLPERADALKRLSVAPFYFTDLVPGNQTTEGKTYKWPNLTKEGYTATLKQPPLAEKPPKKGVIGSAALSVINASGYIYDRVPSAPGNHAKIMIVDDDLYVVGSDNLYPGSLSEFNYLVEGADAVNELLKSYWGPLWKYSGPHNVNAGVNLTPEVKPVTSFDPNFYYRLSTLFRGDKMDLDIFNGGELNNMPHLTTQADFSGQYWAISASGEAGYYRLSTMFRGAEMCLDVYNGGKYNNMTHLVPKANFTGQYWQIEETKNHPGYFRLSTKFRGDKMDLDIFNGGEFNNMPHLTNQADFSGQYWKFEITSKRVVH